MYVIECKFSFDNGACHTSMIKHVITNNYSDSNVKALIEKEMCKGSDDCINDFKIEKSTPIHLADGMVI